MVLILGMSNIVAAIVAAGITPFLSATGCILWDRSWLGSPFSLNLFKCCFGAVIFTIICILIRLAAVDGFTTINFSMIDIAMLAFSAFMSIAIGDNLWFTAMKLIGVRRIIIVDTMKPFIAAVLGAVSLGRPFTLMQLIGILLSSVGLFLASVDRKPKAKVITGEINESRVLIDEEPLDLIHALASVQDIGVLTAIDVDDVRELEMFANSSHHTEDLCGLVDPSTGNGLSSDPIHPNSHDSYLDEDVNDNPIRTPTITGKSPQPKNMPMTTSSSIPTPAVDDNDSGNIDEAELPMSTLLKGYLYAVINVLFDSGSAVVVVQYGRGFSAWEICAVRYTTGTLSLLLMVAAAWFVTGCQDISNRSKTGKKQSYVNRSQSSIISGTSVRDSMRFHSLQQDEELGHGVEMKSGNSIHNGPYRGHPSSHNDNEVMEEDVESCEQYTGKTAVAHNPLHGQEVDSVVSEDILPARSGRRRTTSGGSGGGGDSGNTSTHNNGSDFLQVESQWYEFPHMPKENWQMIYLGTTFVTFCCPILYNFALFQLNVGLVLTLTSLGPIYSIPLVYLLKGEKTTPRACLGALLAVTGVVILCFGEYQRSQENVVTNENN